MFDEEIEFARAALESSYLDDETDADEAIVLLLCALRHYCDKITRDNWKHRPWLEPQDKTISYAGLEGRAQTMYQDDLNGESADPLGAGQSTRHTGWDRIHADNKAEGNPIGGQWSDDGVSYVNGVKVHGPRNYRKP